MDDAIRHTCRSTYPAFHHEGARIQQSIRYIVLHSTEGTTAKAAAEYFMQPASGGSANLTLDDTTCYRSLGDFVIPWGAPPLNTHGFHIEQAGFAKWTRAEWMVHEQTIKRAAYKAALRCRWYKIPPRVLTVKQLQDDYGHLEHGSRIPVHRGPLEGGIVTHATISKAFGLSDHTDPGDGYPIDVFLAHVHEYLKDSDL